MEGLIAEGMEPEMISKGKKVFELRVKPKKGIDNNVVFRFSYNLIPNPSTSLSPKNNETDYYGRTILLQENDFSATEIPFTKAKFDDWFAQKRHDPFLDIEQLTR